MENDVTESLFVKRDPWDSIDHWCGKVRDFLAVVGVIAVIGFVIGWATK